MATAASHVTHYVDFSALTDFIGAGEAMNESLQDPKYRNTVIETAFQQANEVFNTEAAAMAAAGGGIRHMFEWGTIGVNRGRTNARPNPNSERARLWRTSLNGIGKSLTLSYEFKPSLAFVPKPNARTSGMDPAVIASMRDHVFTWKAQVMEFGTVVHIEPKEAKFLLIPYYEGATGFRPHDRKRGYILNKGPISLRPGAKVAGNFTAFWTKFWEGQGNEMMEASVKKQVESDFLPEMAVDYTPIARTPATATNIKADVAAANNKTKKAALAKAKARKEKANGNE